MKVYGGGRENKIFPSVDNGVFILCTHPIAEQGSTSSCPHAQNEIRTFKCTLTYTEKTIKRKEERGKRGGGWVLPFLLHFY